MSFISNLLPTIGTIAGTYFGGGPLGATLGNALGSAFSTTSTQDDARHAQEATNATNIAIADKQMAFQERMSNTAYQRQVADMTAAGINPMLAAANGGGANAPPGAMTRVENPLSTGMTTALQSAQLLQAITGAAKTTAETKLIEKTTDYNTDIAAAEANKRGYEGVAAQWEAALKNLQLNLGKETYSAAVQKAISEAMGASYEQAGKGLNLDLAQSTFEADVKRRKAESQITQYGVEGAKQESRFQQDAGQLPKALQILLQLLSGAHSAKSLWK